MQRIIILIVLFGFSFTILAQQNDWIVKFDNRASISKAKAVDVGISSIEVLSKTLNVYNVKTNKTISRASLLSLLSSIGDVESISENLPIEIRNVEPNDLFYFDQWNLKIIETDRVWDETTGGLDFNGNQVVIAILDDGFDVTHGDLRENYWINNLEIPNDKIDNDGNGYVDDIMGINIQNNTGIHAGVSHGTQVAGILGAVGDNSKGIAGINWSSKLLLVSGVSNIGEIIKGMEYIYDLKKRYLETNGKEGANVVVSNFSGGLSRIFPSSFPSWCEQYDLLGSVGILSVGAVANADFDVEVEGDMPTLCESDYLIMVTNTNISDSKVQDAAYGVVSVDLGAPGENIISTEIGNDYDTFSGTSASAPHVAGAVALIHSIPCMAIANLINENPPLMALTIKKAILDGVESQASLINTVSGGRLNIFNAIFELNELCGSVALEELEITKIRPTLVNADVTSLEVDYATDVFSEHDIFIHDEMGRLILQDIFNPIIFGDRILRISISKNWTPGVYFLSMVHGERISTQRFVIVK